jgi:Tfp pilus assembly protein PilN
MKSSCKKAIGIDVCKNVVNVVRLERDGDKIILTKSMKIAVDNNIHISDSPLDFKLLTHTIKNLKLTSRLDHCDAALCLGSAPDLLQILKLPETTPHNMIKYIHDEIRQYAVLPLKDIKTDYCGLRTTAASDTKQVLVGACQAQPLVEVSSDLGKINVDIRLIEPAIISLIRACYKKVINASQNKNTMIALLRDNVFNICVFSDRKFDFLRTKKLELNNSQPDACAAMIAEQIESVLQFYELEKNLQRTDWQVFLACNPNSSDSVSISEQLKTIIPDKIEINPVLPQHLNIIAKNDTITDFSAVAAGAAMELLDANDSEICINMIPDEISEIRKSNKNLLMIVNTAAVVLMLLFLHIAQLSIRTTQANTEIAKRAKTQSPVSITQLSREQADVNEQMLNISTHIENLEKIMPQNSRVSWAYVLAEVCRKVPQTVQIRNLKSNNLHSLTIEGIAVNYAALTDFINNLSGCKTITSAQLADTEQDVQYGNGFIDYSINCTIAADK